MWRINIDEKIRYSQFPKEDMYVFFKYVSYTGGPLLYRWNIGKVIKDKLGGKDCVFILQNELDGAHPDDCRRIGKTFNYSYYIVGKDSPGDHNCSSLSYIVEFPEKMAKRIIRNARKRNSQ